MPIPDHQHVENEGSLCPFCLSDEIEGGSVTIDGRYATQEVACSACGGVWHSYYILTGYCVVVDPSPKE